MSQHRRWRAAAASLAVVALILTPTAARADDAGAGRKDLGNLSDFITAPERLPGKTRPTGEYFVEFRSEPTASGGTKTQIQRDRSQFTVEARAAKLSADVTHVYTRLFNGVTVKADDAQANKLSGLGSVKDVYPVLAMRAPTAPPSPETAATRASLAMIGADKAQTELGLTGDGITVGIIDSGIDYNHPDLGGTGDQDSTTFPTQRITHGWDFIGDDYSPWPDESGEISQPEPDADPMDCMGHGTHVAGTIGGEGKVLGVAPEVSLGAYKVFTCEGDTTMAIVLDAMERASSDGMDVVNMSLGWPLQGSPTHPLSQAADRMVDAGVVLVVAAGNEGEFGTQTLSVPSVADKAISVASFDSTSTTMPAVEFIPAVGETIESGYTTLTVSPAPTGFSGELATFSDALQCKLDPTLAGKVAIFSGIGGCDVQRRTQLALDSGAIGVVAYADFFFFDFVDSGDAPAIGILTDTAQQVLDAMEAGPVTINVPGTFIDDPNPYTPGLTSWFTSWGLAADLSLKPDLGAPGGSIFSTLPLSMGGSGVYSGTSMASPHVAGSVALMLQSDPALTAKEARERLQNTASPALFSFMPESGVLDAAHRQGAGLIHVDKAITLKSPVSPAKLSTGQSADGPFTQTITLTNATDAPVTWAASHEDAVTTASAWQEGRLQDQPDFTQESTQVTFSAASVTVPARGSATVDVTIVPSEDTADTATYSGFLRFTSGTETIGVPFAGIKGDWSDAPTLLGDDSDYPPMQGVLYECQEWVDRLCVDEEPMFGGLEPDDVFTHMPGMYPAVAYTLATQPSSVTVTVLQADDDGQPIEDTEQLANVARDPWRSPFGNVSAWDGQWMDEDTGELDVAADGEYVLRLHVSNHDTPVQTITWTSPTFLWEIETEPEPEPEPTSPSPKPTETPDVYNTPGLHEINGRKWFTSCEPYSQTVRCRTMIWATQVTQVNGAFQQHNGWVFNNLTYLPHMKRAEWGANPLAVTGSWTSGEGRKWRTECDTALTGGGGCRSFITSSVIEAKPRAGGGYSYRWVTKEVFNNMVRFQKN
ncbi:MAG: S8 family serine peptidase [Propionibacteriaceae bacterium]|nr:S8 family serine peptidase [Propionibacteriaceae bacterium]